ncbi:hypothetical protein [Xenorhabdus kozodoii]|nr:hypothetical protein [Xenorhabdus kozodoii]
MEELSGVRTKINDPALNMLQSQQPKERFDAFQRQVIDELKLKFNL